jgi:branched-chain amino acid transport system permease protein
MALSTPNTGANRILARKYAWCRRETAVALTAMVALGILPEVAAYVDNPFLARVGMRIMILGLAALSLNLILGYGGMVSLGHAAFIGIAAYVIAIMNWHVTYAEPLISWPMEVGGSANPAVVVPLAILMSSVAALIIGFISLRTSGLYFIMITLAFAQMLFYLFVAFRKYGGEDGTQLLEPLTIGPVDFNDRIQLYYIILGSLIAALALVDRIVHSRFGVVLQACRQNERRVEAIGYSTFHYKLAAFVLAGAIAGLAGVLLAASQEYVSPADLAWARSGELIIMLVIGGVGTLFGPLFGSMIYVVLEVVLGSWTTHWQIFFGPVLIFFVLFVRRGVSGLFADLNWRPKIQ